MKKRIIALLLCAAMLCGMVLTSGFDASSILADVQTAVAAAETEPEATPAPTAAPLDEVTQIVESVVTATYSETAPVLTGEPGDPVAKIGDVEYETLAAAIAAANANDTITLLSNITLTDTVRIEKALTIDGTSGDSVFTISTETQKAFEVHAPDNATEQMAVTFKNVAITNSASGGRCIDTRTDGIELNLNNVTLTASNATSQPLTIGGTTTGGLTVNITGSTISAGSTDNNQYSYGIISFVPVDMTITDSAVSGRAAVYMKDGSVGSKVTITNSTLNGANYSNDADYVFGPIALEDKVLVTLTGTSTVTATGTNQSVICLGTAASGGSTVTVEESVALNGDILHTDITVVNNLATTAPSIIVPKAYQDALASEGYVVGEGGSITNRFIDMLLNTDTLGNLYNLMRTETNDTLISGLSVDELTSVKEHAANLYDKTKKVFDDTYQYEYLCNKIGSLIYKLDENSFLAKMLADCTCTAKHSDKVVHDTLCPAYIPVPTATITELDLTAGTTETPYVSTTEAGKVLILGTKTTANPEGTYAPLTYAMQFEAAEYSEAQLAYYGDWIADFAISTNTDLPLVDAALAGQYDLYNYNQGDGWVYAAGTEEGMQMGDQTFYDLPAGAEVLLLRDLIPFSLTFKNAKDFIEEFRCGVWVDEDFLAAKPGFCLTVKLNIYPTNASGVCTYENPVTCTSINYQNGITIDSDAAVAKIGDTYFKSIQAAADAAKSGDAIVLLKNISTDARALTVDDKSIILNLGEYNIVSSYDPYTIDVNSGAELTILGTGTIENTSAGSTVIRNYGTLTIGEAGEAGPTITRDQTTNGAGNSAVKCEETATLTIYSGTFGGDKRSIQSWGTTTIYGGTFEKTVEAWEWTTGEKVYDSTLNIYGGSFAGEVTAHAEGNANNMPTIAIIGGMFTQKPAVSMLAADYAAIKPDGEAMYSIVPACDATITIGSDDGICTVTGNGFTTKVVLEDGTKTVKLPVGTYTVFLDTSWGWRYKNTQSGTLTVSENGTENSFTPTTTRNNQWFSGTAAKVS